MDLPAGCTVRELLSNCPGAAWDQPRAWLCVEPGTYWLPLGLEHDVATFGPLACIYHGEATAIMFRHKKDPSPVNTPKLSRAPSPTALLFPEIANEIEPFTQEAVKDLAPESCLELPLPDGRSMIIDIESLTSFIASERGKGISLAEVIVRGTDRHGKPISCKLTRQVWHDRLLRSSNLTADFIEQQLFAMDSEIAATFDLALLRDNVVACKGIVSCSSTHRNLPQSTQRTARIAQTVPSLHQGFSAPYTSPGKPIGTSSADSVLSRGSNTLNSSLLPSGLESTRDLPARVMSLRSTFRPAAQVTAVELEEYSQ
ncbi:hypothetical protein HDU89_001749 [Geranomyces variabilis]|nr:hypothetical protein HDU89_001749 [Geranomyces variabilis]